jgi:hypothetical protein
MHHGIHRAHIQIPFCLSKDQTCHHVGAPDSLVAPQVLLGQLDYLPSLPNTVPALHRLCNTPEVLELCRLHQHVLGHVLCSWLCTLASSCFSYGCLFTSQAAA